MELGGTDESSRRRPIPKPGSDFVMELDMVIPALGTQTNPLVPRNIPGLETSECGTSKADENGRITKRVAWASGGIVIGAATVIGAMGAGNRAVADIDACLRGRNSLKLKEIPKTY